MLKTIVAVVAGFFVFFAIVYGVGLVMRVSWSDYAAVADPIAFTLPMLIARLAIGVVAALVAGWATARLASKPHAAAIALGILLVVFFIPVHVQLWSSFPVWYHLFFLLTLLPLSVAGGIMAGRRLRQVLGKGSSALDAGEQNEL